MDLKFRLADIDYTISSMKEFLSYDRERYIESLVYFYKDLDRATIVDDREFDKAIRRLYDENKDIFIEKQVAYQAWWDEHRLFIETEFEKVFEVDLEDRFNGMEGSISLNPVMPRYLSEEKFDIFYLNSEKGALGTAFHEICHFLWFDIWQDHFKDDEKEYETPHLKWIFSEMVVDTILNNSRLKELNPYDKPSYKEFYDIEIEGRPLMDIINKLYLENSMIDFMEKGYEFCLDNSSYIEDIR